MIQNISFCGAHGRYIANKAIDKATMAELAEAMNRGIEAAGKKLGQKLETLDGKRITGVMLQGKLPIEYVKNGRLTDLGLEALAQKYRPETFDLGGLKESVASIAACNAYAETADKTAKVLHDLTSLPFS